MVHADVVAGTRRSKKGYTAAVTQGGGHLATLMARSPPECSLVIQCVHLGQTGRNSPTTSVASAQLVPCCWQDLFHAHLSILLLVHGACHALVSQDVPRTVLLSHHYLLRVEWSELLHLLLSSASF